MQLPILLSVAAFFLPLSVLAAAGDPGVTTEYTVVNTCSRKTRRGDAVRVFPSRYSIAQFGPQISKAVTAMCSPPLVPLSSTHPFPSTKILLTTSRPSQIQVHYRGTLESDGTEFDASYNRGQPLSFTVGKGQVIKGWDDGLLEMCIGDKRKLTIPPEFGYGQRAMGPIPAGSTLIFETELVAIEGVEKDEL